MLRGAKGVKSGLLMAANVAVINGHWRSQIRCLYCTPKADITRSGHENGYRACGVSFRNPSGLEVPMPKLSAIR
jgi:hypothetical protein